MEMASVDNEDAIASITSALVEQAFCSSWDEAAAIVDAIRLETIINKGNEQQEEEFPSFAACSDLWQTGLQEYLGVSKEVSRQILLSAFRDENGESLPDVKRGNRERRMNDDDDNDDDDEGEEDSDDSDTDLIEEGECELCERSNIKLTRHHLVPRSTWPRIETKLLHAANATDPEKANMIAGENLKHLIPPRNCEEETGLRKKKWIKGALQRTCLICRACHSAVHNTHENMVLALEYNTVDKLLQDAKICSFCKWASKQRAGKYAI